MPMPPLEQVRGKALGTSLLPASTIPAKRETKLRVLMITGAFFPKVDGSVIAASNLIEALAQKGHQVTVLTRTYEQGHEEELNGVRVERVSQRGFSLVARLMLVIQQVRRGSQLMKGGEQFDVIHAHGFSSLMTAEVLRLFRRAPVVVTFHGLQRFWNRDWSPSWFFKFAFLLPLEGLLARRANLVVAQSAKLKSVLISLYGIRPAIITVLPNPVDTKMFAFHLPVRTSKVVLFVGAIGTIYGPDILVRAAEHVLRQIPDAKFVFVGAGPAEKYVTELARSLGVERSVELVGRVDYREELEGYYASSRVLVIPFRGRGGYILSLAALESMAVGRPVIIGYEIDDAVGVIHTSNDPTVLAQRIVEVLSLSEEEYTNLARAVRSSVESSGSAEVASKLETAYLNLIELAGVPKQPQDGRVENRPVGVRK
jgi:glycosyltransferase involved in cell wall biosynthesis